MNVLSLLSSVSAPKDLWTILINAFQGGIQNFGWTILLLTIIVKLVLSPLDFGVKYTTKMQNLVQQKCAPEIAKIKKKFGADQQRVRIQTQSLYKREGMKTGISCLVMFLNLVLTMVVFFTFYASLQKNTTYQAIKEYETLNATYTQSFEKSFAGYSDEDDITTENAKEMYNKYFEAEKFCQTHSEQDEKYAENKAIVDSLHSAFDSAKKAAEKDVVKVWKDTKAGWLWIDNIWVADSTTSPFPSYDNLKGKASGSYKEGDKKISYKSYIENNISKDEYNVIAEIVNEQGGRTKNGYYILAVLAAVVTFLSQYITELHTKLKNKKANIIAKASADSSMGMSMKIMKIVMPIIMLIFVLTSSASFGIYILSSNIATIALGEIITLIINKLTKKKQTEVEEFLEKEANRLIKKGKLQEK